MILDKSLLLSDAQAEVTSAASTSHIDTLAKGQAYQQPWFVARIDTAVTSGGSLGKVQFEVQDSANGEFYDGTTLASSAAILTSALTAGYVFAARLPKGARRYIRGYVKNTVMPITAGAWDMFIVQDYPIGVGKEMVA